MNKTNLTQVCGGMGFAYFLGALAIHNFPITEKIQVIGLVGFAALSFLVFIYGTFVKGEKEE